jgi:hypothetical protein
MAVNGPTFCADGIFGEPHVKFTTDHTLRSYQDGKQSVIVTDSDVTGQNIELAPANATKKDLDLDELMKN